MLSRVYFSGYLIRALSVTMNSWAQIPLPGRQVSSDRDYVLQALHVLDTMGNDIAIHRVANLMRELFTLLSGPLEITALPRARMNNGTSQDSTQPFRTSQAFRHHVDSLMKPPAPTSVLST